MEQDGSLIGLNEHDRDALEDLDRRTYNKRKDHTGLDAAAKRQALVAPAGQKTASGGIVMPRNNEVFETSAASVPALSVPDDVKLVVGAAAAHTKGAADDAVCIVDCLDRLADDGATGAKEPLPVACARAALPE
eukprot:6906687-Prymnesium_polylepis.1